MNFDDIVKAALLVIRDGRMLLCRKSRDTDLLITPGGRIELGESDIDCLHRETAEELGVGVHLVNIQYIDTYRDQAAGALHRIVELRLYRADLQGEQPSPHAEIAELIWFAPSDDHALLSPSLRNKILPDLMARGLL